MKPIDFYRAAQPDRRESAAIYPKKISFILRHARPAERVLDLGCNDGEIGAFLVQAGLEVHGIDFVEENLSAARARGLHTRLLDLEEESLPYEDSFFDAVVLADVIEHVFDTDSLLLSARRVLRIGGHIIITTPNVASLARRLMLALGVNPFLEYSASLPTNGMKAVGHIRYYTARDLRRQLEHNGYHVGIAQIPSLGQALPTLSPYLLCAATRS
jgi:methionine biosynthesis protein MetW